MRWGKRAFDLVVVLALSPLTLLAALGSSVVVLASVGRPLFYRQERIGLHGVPFDLLKLRTMRPQPPHQELLDFERTTPATRVLRRLSVDEVTSLWNVFRGDMSLVGPRPLPVRYRAVMSDRELRRESVRPGITGLAQVSGRNSLGWDERLEMDVQYAEHVSLVGDMALLAKTLPAVFTAKGLDHEAQLRLKDLDVERASQ